MLSAAVARGTAPNCRLIYCQNKASQSAQASSQSTDYITLIQSFAIVVLRVDADGHECGLCTAATVNTVPITCAMLAVAVDNSSQLQTHQKQHSTANTLEGTVLRKHNMHISFDGSSGKRLNN